jgi:hypothetical protein
MTMKGGLGNIMKQAQAMKESLRKAQEALAQIEVTGSAGGGLVTIVMTCRHEVKRVNIDPALLGDEKEMIEDLLAAAMNDAARQVEATSQQKMAGMTAGLGFPGLNLPF